MWIANRISPELKTGTLGELLVQLRLLQYDVQAAQPLKDSGNDLIGVRGAAFRAIQVKATTTECFDCRRLKNKKYHLLALVHLVGQDRDLYLDQCRIYVLRQQDVQKSTYYVDELAEFSLSAELVDRMFNDAAT